MAELLERLHALKNKDSDFDKFSEEVKSSINGMKVDTTEITGALQTALMSLFNTQNVIDEERKGKIIKALGESEEYIEDISKKQQMIIEGLDQAVGKIESSIKSIEIPKTDLSKIEKSIKGIKPTDVSRISGQIQALASVVAELKNVEQPKMNVDLQPILDAINKTKTVTFEVETDQWGFPKKVTARES